LFPVASKFIVNVTVPIREEYSAFYSSFQQVIYFETRNDEVAQVEHA